MQRGCFQSMKLFTGHGNDLPICGMRDCRDSDKMMYNTYPLNLNLNLNLTKPVTLTLPLPNLNLNLNLTLR